MAEPTFKEVTDINDELPVIKKVKCSGKRKDPRRRLIYGEDKCGQVYLRIVDKEECATELDKIAAKSACPICQSEEWEPIAKYDVSPDGLRVIIKPNQKW